MSNALIVVDVQNDFCEGGALAVDGGAAVATRIASYIENYHRNYDFVLFTKDWHNPLPDSNGGHFSATPDFKDSWPVHCVANTPGAQFHEALWKMPFSGDHVFYKGQGRPDYSGFQGINLHDKTLGEYLTEHDVRTLDIVGIAGDYCVLQTALDAQKWGFDPVILTPMVASVGGDAATLKAAYVINHGN